MEKIRLEEIAPIKQGNCDENDNVWLLNLDMVESNTGKIIDYLYVSKDEIGNSTISFDCSNVLYSKLRPYLNKVVMPLKCGFATSEMLPLKPDTKRITREYLTFFLRSKNFVEYINSKTCGAKMPRANTQDLKEVLVPCPCIDEQVRIAATLGKISKIIDLRKLQLEQLDNLIKSRFVEMFGEPKKNPYGWNNVKVEEILDVRGRVGWKGYKKEDLRQEGPLVLGATHIDKGGNIDLSSPVYLSAEKYKESPEIMLQVNDLIFTQRGNTIGKIGLLQDDIGESTINPCVLILRPLKVNPIYVKIYFLLESTIHDMWDINSGSAQPMITQKGINEYKLMYPPLELQNQFSAFVQQVNKLIAEVQKSMNETQMLFDSLMQKFFNR